MNWTETEVTALAAAIAHQRSDLFPHRLMAFINAVVSVDITLVVGFSPDTRPVELFRDFDAHSEREYLKRYAEGAYLLDPFYKISVDGTASGLYALRDVAPDRFFRTEYYASYYSNLPLVDEFCLTHHGLPPISTGQSGMIMEGSSLCLRTCLCPTRSITASR